ncbi:MAG TPA: tetratricopeptide repeat protein [Bryobacterales bacterium]|jgi:tetratricopeptide (TPR) repeat protein|nr:tetratricopeptide repeat protein [Bryobacterales bacterium]
MSRGFLSFLLALVIVFAPLPSAVAQALDRAPADEKSQSGRNAGASGSELLQQGRDLLAKGSAAEAVPLLRQAIEKNPADADAHLLLGSALALIPRRSEAVAELALAIELRPDHAPAYNVLGMTLARFAEFDSAQKAFEKAIAIDPKLAGAHLNLALVFAQKGEIARASRAVARAIELYGDTVSAAYPHYVAGRLYNQQNLPGRALQEFEAAIRLNPKFSEAFLELGSAKRKLSDEAGCIDALRKAVELAPENAEARYRLGVEYLNRRQAAKAVEHLGAAYRLKPGDRGILYNYSRALRLEGQEEQAKIIFRKLSETVSATTKASQHLAEAARLTNEGVALEKQGDFRAAVEKYRAALELDPLEASVRRNLGLALCRAGRWSEGIAELQEAQRIDPNDAETTRALYIAREQEAAAQGR